MGVRSGLTDSSRASRPLILLFILFCILSFLNRSPYGEPSRAVAIALAQSESESTSDCGVTDTQKHFGTSDEDKKPQKVWKKYVLDKVILPLPILLITEAQLHSYQLSGKNRHTLSFKCSGLAPPFVA